MEGRAVGPFTGSQKLYEKEIIYEIRIYIKQINI